MSRREVPEGGRATLTRRTFLQAAAAVAGSTLAGPAPRRPHIVLVVDDQHHPRALSAWGEMGVRTPALDRLAAASVVFPTAYAASPVCGPSRASIFTGRYPSEHGVRFNEAPMRELPTLAGLLGAAGYTTASIGKLHAAPYHDRRGFQYVLHHEFDASGAGISHYHAYLRAALRKERRPLPERPADELGLVVETLPEELTPGAWVTDRSLDFVSEQLRERPGTPFLLHASYVGPHPPFAPLRKYLDLYPPGEVDLPPTFDARACAEWSRRTSLRRAIGPEEARRMRAYYLAFVTQLDHQIGRLLDGLDALLGDAPVLLVFVSDHGEMAGEHGRFNKGVMYEASIGVPAMVRFRGLVPRRERTPYSHVDLLPTLLAAAGAGVPADLPGMDLGPVLRGQDACPGRESYAELLDRDPFAFLMLRRDAWKLWLKNDGGRERSLLFDLERDPLEAVDRAGDPACARVRAELEAALRERRARLAEVSGPLPAPVPRARYKIEWPADPWSPVLPEPPA